MPRPASWQRSPAPTCAETHARVGRFELLRLRRPLTRNGAFMVAGVFSESVNVSAVLLAVALLDPRPELPKSQATQLELSLML